jgi:hypothetical protein
MTMKMVMVSYSMTGNNDALAANIAAELGIERVRITEPKVRTSARIALDMLFNRTPKVCPAVKTADGYDPILFVGPVWMGHVAAPLRANLKHLRGGPSRYAFISISGGADGPNPSLVRDLTKMTGRAPAALIDLHIADLLLSDPKHSGLPFEEPGREGADKHHIEETAGGKGRRGQRVRENSQPRRR